MNEEREVVKQSVLSPFELTARIKKTYFGLTDWLFACDMLNARWKNGTCNDIKNDLSHF